MSMLMVAPYFPLPSPMVSIPTAWLNAACFHVQFRCELRQQSPPSFISCLIVFSFVLIDIYPLRHPIPKEERFLLPQVGLEPFLRRLSVSPSRIMKRVTARLPFLSPR